LGRKQNAQGKQRAPHKKTRTREAAKRTELAAKD
jgi:hypothetical protein